MLRLSESEEMLIDFVYKLSSLVAKDDFGASMPKYCCIQ